MKLTYPAIFTYFKEDGSYSVEFPDLAGCATGGATLTEAMEMGRDAASGWILTELEDGNTLPVASKLNQIHRKDTNSFVNFILLDMDPYIAKYSKRSVRKNLTIPQWLDVAAEKLNINFSEVLQEALLQKVNGKN